MTMTMLTRVCRSCAIASRQVVARPERGLVGQPRRSNSTAPPSTSTPSPTPSPNPSPRPSPYRLIPVSKFLADFAPLHIKGWRLDNLPHPHSQLRHTSQPKEGGMVELQDRHLTRRYDFELGPGGWRALMEFMQTIGEAVEAEDHHPSIHISPAADTTTFPPLPKTVGYVIQISTHTHTPLPPLKYEHADGNGGGKMRPGVTGKDMKLAARLEELYEATRSGSV